VVIVKVALDFGMSFLGKSSWPLACNCRGNAVEE